MTTGKNLSSTLESLYKIVDFSAVTEAKDTIVAQFDAIKKTTLGSTIGEIKGGVEALTKEIDDASKAGKANFVPTVSRITSNISGLSDRLVGTVPGSIATDISKITETAGAAADGFLQEIISVASPEGINAALKKAVGATPQELQSTFASIADTNLSGFIQDALTKTPFGALLNSTSQFTSQLNSVLGLNSEQFLVDLNEKLGKGFQNKVNEILGKVVGDADVATAFAFVASGNYDEGFKAIEKYIDLPSNYYTITDLLPQSEWPADVLEAFERLNNARGEFQTLDVSLSSSVNMFDPSLSAAGQNTQPVVDIGKQPIAGGGGAPNAGTPDGSGSGITKDGDTWDFSVIKSSDELEALFRSINRSPGREIVGAVIHWSATYLNQNIGAEWIHDVHIRDRGFQGCGYHIIIRRDGSLQRGRPLNLAGAHDINNNETFLGFCFVGGVNTTSNNNSEPSWKYASSESFTPAQYNTYDQLMRVFHRVFPHGQVAGHYMTSNDGKVDPGFDVVAYSLSKFGHQNVIPEGDPIWRSSSVITLDTLRQYGAQFAAAQSTPTGSNAQ